MSVRMGNRPAVATDRHGQRPCLSVRARLSLGQGQVCGVATRAAELVRKLEQLTAQHAATLTRAITELRSAADPESAEAEVYAARTSADQRIAAAEARLAEEITRRRDAETERDQARADRDQADDATAQAITRMEELQHELATLRHTTEEQLAQLRAETTAELELARTAAQREIDQTRE
jgi:colicin import membrane protein